MQEILLPITVTFRRARLKGTTIDSKEFHVYLQMRYSKTLQRACVCVCVCAYVCVPLEMMASLQNVLLVTDVQSAVFAGYINTLRYAVIALPCPAGRPSCVSSGLC